MGDLIVQIGDMNVGVLNDHPCIAMKSPIYLGLFPIHMGNVAETRCEHKWEATLMTMIPLSRKMSAEVLTVHKECSHENKSLN